MNNAVISLLVREKLREVLIFNVLPPPECFLLFFFFRENEQIIEVCRQTYS